MSERLDTWLDASIGETREALVRDGRVIALRTLRASDAGKVAHWGEVYRARVADIDRRRRGAFIDLGIAQQGFLPLDDDGRVRIGQTRVPLTQGARIAVAVVREAARDKSPVLQLVSHPDQSEPIGRVAQHDSDQDLARARPANAATRAGLDEAFDAALYPDAPIPGGGVLRIAPTAALVAIDVDAAGRAGAGDPERFAFELNVAAAQEAARQLRLRSLGGVVAIDFVSLRAKSHRERLEHAVRAAFADDPWTVQFGTLSRFGVFELARAQLRTPLHEVMLDAEGRLSAESVALAALRAIEREASAQGGRRIAAAVAPEVKAWLDGAPFDWRTALNNRIGARWSLEAGAGPREKMDVRAQ